MVFLICVVVCVVFPFSPPCSDVGAYVVLGMLFACVSFKQGLLVCLLKKVHGVGHVSPVAQIDKLNTFHVFRGHCRFSFTLKLPSWPALANLSFPLINGHCP